MFPGRIKGRGRPDDSPHAARRLPLDNLRSLLMKTPLKTSPRHAIKALLILFGLAGPIVSSDARAAIKESVSYANDGKSTILTCADEASGKPVVCPEPSVKREKGRAPVEIAFNEGDFDELDKIFDRVSSGDERFVDGTSYLQAYQNTLAMLYQTWQRWDEDLAKIKEWQRLRPASTAARFAEAIYWQSFAWNARGSAYAHAVKKEGWELFRQRLAKASAVMELLRPQAKRLPAWYALKIELAMESGMDKEARAIFDEGVAQHRQYYPLYLEMARSYEPKWGGSIAQFEGFANEAVKLAKGFEGRGMYSRIFWTVDYTHGIPFRSEKESVPNWKKLNAGFADLLKLYPKSHSILNQYASVACRSGDGALYRKLRTKLGDYLNESYFKIDPVDVCDVRHKWQAPANKH